MVDTDAMVDKIRQQIAMEHGVLLDDNDPILVTVTLNEALLKYYLDLVSEQHERANQALADTLQKLLDQQTAAAKETAGRVITDAATYVDDRMRTVVTSALSEAEVQLRRQVAEAAANSQSAQTAKGGAYGAAILSGIAALVSIATFVFMGQ